jgi:6-phospho-5-dehydro-2-deoxy-D-gluconate aldolase
MKEMLVKAKEEGYAVGQYNMNSFQWAQAILQAAEEERAPLILASTDKNVDYLGGFQTIAAAVKELMKQMNITVPVALHLDHGMSPERCKQAIEAGYSSVMIDGSHAPIEENIKLTKEVVGAAHPHGVSVEAEVGTVGGVEDGMEGNIKYADPNECLRLVNETGVDALAAALGSVHGPYKGEPKLGFDEMKQISKMTDIPLVLHGGTGIPSYQVQKAIGFGHEKINVNTETTQAWTKAVRGVLAGNPELFDPRKILTAGKEAITKAVKEKMREFGTSGKA